MTKFAESSPPLARLITVTPETIRAHIRKIIASRVLVRSERLARFLQFTVEETLAGHSDQLKEFVIGMEVFDRRDNYDPRLDPIVRVEARRLRSKLAKYYEFEGRDDAIRIEYPKGGYAPVICLKGDAGGDKQSTPRSHTASRQAYHRYLKGRYHWNKRTDEAVARGITDLKEAIALDPAYALAYSGLADCYIVLAKFGAEMPREFMPLARAAAERALTLDPTLAEAHVSLGSIAAIFDWDWAGAERHFRRAIELKPDYATAHQWYGHDYLAAVGRLKQAEQELERARDCDPLSLVILSSSGENFAMQRRPVEALQYFAQSLELDPYFPRGYFGTARALLQLRRCEEAVEALQRGLALDPHSPMALAVAAHVYSAAGRESEAKRMLSALERMAASQRIPAYVFMRAWMMFDPKRSCDYLEQAFEERDPRLVHIAVSPVYDPLRGQPRFESTIRSMGLVLEAISA
ncbi:MAG TPA: tetratricopeptide repeat protein [Bryobacteraceae bacterium]|nr:tetratricopeptide repeat protein [Bryobacteraceae bacterium]